MIIKLGDIPQLLPEKYQLSDYDKKTTGQSATYSNLHNDFIDLISQKELSVELCESCNGTGENPEAKQAWDIPEAPTPDCPDCTDGFILKAKDME